MITDQSLPSGYAPFPLTDFCSNKIIGESFLISIGNVIPVLIGKGTPIRIWLQAAADPKGSQFVTIVNDSVKMHELIDISAESKKITIESNGTTILKAMSIDENHLVIDEIDLRPLGISVHGDKYKLIIGNGTTLQGNTFSNVKTAISFEKPSN